MPELGPYGSMRGEVRENLPYRDFETENPTSEINGLRISKVSLTRIQENYGYQTRTPPALPYRARARRRRVSNPTSNGTPNTASVAGSGVAVTVPTSIVRVSASAWVPQLKT